MKTLLTTLAIVALTLGSCKKSEKTSPEPIPSDPTVPIKNENDKRKLKFKIQGYDSLVIMNKNVYLYNKIAFNSNDSIDVIAYVHDTININIYAGRFAIMGEAVKVYKDYNLDIIYALDANVTSAKYIVQ